MKKHFFNLIFLCLLFSQNVQGQAPNTQGSTHIFNYELLVEAPIYQCDILGNQIDTAFSIAPKGAIFTKVDVKGSDIVIRFFLWKKNPHLNETLNYTDSTKTERKYFLLSTAEFNLKAIPRYTKKTSFTVGATHIPFRIRNNPFDFSNHLSIGTSFGAKYPLSNTQDMSLNLLAGINIANITLDSLSTKGLADAGETAAAFTPSLGAVFEYSKVQVGIYLGWDFLSGSDKDIWIYQGKPWVSIGVGVSIFTADNSSSANSTGTNTQ